MPAKHVKQKKHIKKIEEHPKINTNEWPAVVYFWMFGLAFLGYFIAESVFRTAWPHPGHWLLALIGGGLGIPGGWLWYRWRGDVF